MSCSYLAPQTLSISAKAPHREYGALIEEYDYEIAKIRDDDLLSKSLTVFDEYNVKAVAIYGHPKGYTGDDIETLINKTYAGKRRGGGRGRDRENERAIF